MKKIYILFSLLVFSVVASAQCSDLYFSEYSEGSSNHKYLEIYNPTSSAIDLSAYSIYMINNGGTSNDVALTLSGTLEAHDVYVLSTDQADSAAIQDNADITFGYNSVTHFNGDDALCLIKGTDTIDVIGERWMDPGSNWPVDTGSTANHTLVRKSHITGGQTDWTIGATEWDVYPQNTWDYIGSHRSICAGIRNAGYDIQGEDSYRDFWRNLDFEAQIPNTNLLQITSSPVHMGAKAGKFPSSGERIAYQAVTVKPLTYYKIKFWYTIKTGNVGSATVHILEGDIRDTANVAGAIITSKTVNDQTSANDYVQDSIEFWSGASDIAAIYLRNEGEECRFDTWEIEEGTPPVVAAIQNPGFDIEGDDSYRNFWRNSAFEDSASSSAMIQITSGPTHNGSAKAAKLPSDGSRAGYQAVDVNPNTDYIVTYWYTMKTSPAGSANVAILGMDLVDPALVAANTIASSTVMDQTDANTYIKDSVGFNSGASNQIAIYFTNTGVETRFDSWGIYEGIIPVTEPMTAAPTPTQAAEDVISIYSQSYTDPAGINYYPGWGQNTQIADFAIGMDSMIKYSSLNYQGIDFDASEIDASAMEMLHIDIWTADVDDIDIFPISRASGEKAVKTTLTAGEWNSIDIPLSDYTSQGLSMSDIFQFKFDNLGASRDVGTIFIDNMYMWKEPTLVYTVSTIADAIQLDADLAPTNEDALYELTGVVYGVDLDGNAGISFTIIDATGGMNIYNFNDVNDYVVTEGDEITVRGKIDFYNGLLELFPDSIKLNSAGNVLKDAVAVDAPSEATESDFIVLSKVWITNDTTTVWPDNGNVELTNNNADTFQIRIDRDIPGIVGMAVEYDTMVITGLGGQFDGSAPYDEGYQIFPRGLGDIAEWVDKTSVREFTVEARVYPNPAQNNLTVVGSEKWNTFEVYNIVGSKVSEGELNNNNLSVTDLVEGTYIIKLQAGDKAGVARFVINR